MCELTSIEHCDGDNLVVTMIATGYGCYPNENFIRDDTPQYMIDLLKNGSVSHVVNNHPKCSPCSVFYIGSEEK